MYSDAGEEQAFFNWIVPGISQQWLNFQKKLAEEVALADEGEVGHSDSIISSYALLPFCSGMLALTRIVKCLYIRIFFLRTIAFVLLHTITYKNC